MDDTNLLQTLVDASGLPEEFIIKTLARLMAHANVNPDQVTLDDMRTITADYLQDVFTELLDEGLRIGHSA